MQIIDKRRKPPIDWHLRFGADMKSARRALQDHLSIAEEFYTTGGIELQALRKAIATIDRIRVVMDAAVIREVKPAHWTPELKASYIGRNESACEVWQSGDGA